jgi:hypothetical protein
MIGVRCMIPPNGRARPSPHCFRQRPMEPGLLIVSGPRGGTARWSRAHGSTRGATCLLDQCPIVWRVMSSHLATKGDGSRGTFVRRESIGCTLFWPAAGSLADARCGLREQAREFGDGDAHRVRANGRARRSIAMMTSTRYGCASSRVGWGSSRAPTRRYRAAGRLP